MTTPGVFGALVLLKAIRRAVISPRDLLNQLQRGELERAFRDLVRKYVPDDAAAILGSRRAGPNGEADRLYSFCHAFEQKYFPIMEFEELEYVLWGVPFQRMGWDYDELHEPDRFRPEFQMMLALMQLPYEEEGDTGMRLVLLDALEPVVGKDVLSRLGPAIEPSALHLRLDNGPYKALAEFADWVWGETDTAFLDITQDMEVQDADWEEATIDSLTQQWQVAKAILHHIDELSGWLALDPPRHFAMLAAAAATPHPSEKTSPIRPRRRLIDIFKEDDNLHAQEEESPTPTPDPADPELAVPADTAV